MSMLSAPVLLAINPVLAKSKTILAQYMKDGRYVFDAVRSVTVQIEVRKPGMTDWALYWRPICMLPGDTLQVDCKDGVVARLVTE